MSVIKVVFPTWQHESGLFVLRAAAEDVSVAAVLMCVSCIRVCVWQQQLASVSLEEVCLLISQLALGRIPIFHDLF